MSGAECIDCGMHADDIPTGGQCDVCLETVHGTGIDSVSDVGDIFESESLSDCLQDIVGGLSIGPDGFWQ